MQRYAIYGTSVGENGITYASRWCRFITSSTQSGAEEEAVRIVKAQGGPTAHICKVTDSLCLGSVEICKCCGKYHD